MYSILATCFFFAGVARGQPRWLLPPWVLCVIYPLVAVLLGACLAVIGLYGSFLSRTVVLMWLVSAVSAFLTSAVLLEPLKVSGSVLSKYFFNQAMSLVLSTSFFI